MFEKYISNILVEALSQYAEDIDPTQLQLKIFSGTATLNNLKLKASAFDGLGLPFKLSRAICKRINIDIPIRNLQSKACVADIEDLYIILKSPLDEPATEEAYAQAERKAKEAVIAAYEAERKKRAAEKGEEESGFVSRLTEVIINNVIINIKAVHIRFERPSHGIIFGAMLQDVTVKTTDLNGNVAFVDPHSSMKVVKRLDFKGLQLYAEPQHVVKGQISSDSGTYLSLEKDLDRWQSGMKRRLTEGAKSESTIFGPVDGFFLAEVMFQQRIKDHPDKPYASVRVNLENFIAKLSRKQYLTILDIAAQATNASLMTAIQHFRPAMPHTEITAHKGPRGTNKAAQAWWRYAARAINEVGLYKRHRELRSKLLMPRYCSWLSKTVVSDIISGNESLMKLPEYKALVLTESQIKLRDGVFDRMVASDIVKCRHASQAAITQEVGLIRSKIAALQAEKASKRSSSWFSWGKTSEEKDDEKALDELQKEWGIDGPEVVVDTRELPANYEWLRLSIGLGVGGVHLLLSDTDAVMMNLSKILIGVSIFNAPGKDSTAFTFTAEDWTVTNPDSKTKKEIPYLIRQMVPGPTSAVYSNGSGSTSSFAMSSSQSFSNSKFLAISGASKPVGVPVDFQLKLGVQPLLVIADPAFLTQMAYFFVIPPTLDLSALTHTTKVYVSTAAAQASEAAAAAVSEAKVIDATIDIRAPVAIIPQSTDMLDGPCMVLSLGRLRVEASPFSEEEKRDPRNAEEMHYYRNKAELTDLYVTCGSFRRALAETNDGFPIVPPIHLSAKLLLRANSMDFSRANIVLDCKSNALKVGFSTHTAYLITSMTSMWAIKAKESVRELEEQAQVLPSQRTFTSPVQETVINQLEEQRRVINSAVELAQKSGGSVKREAVGVFLKVGVHVEQFSLELFDDNGVSELMKKQMESDPDGFLNGRAGQRIPVIVPPRSSISNHPQFVLRTSPMLVDATMLEGGGMTVTATLTSLEGFQNYLALPKGGAYNQQTISRSLTVLGGGSTLVVGVEIHPPPTDGARPKPMGINVELQKVVELHLCTPLLLMLESAMDVINMLLGVVDDFEASGSDSTKGSDLGSMPSPADQLPTQPVLNEPKLALAFRAAGLKAFIYNNYYYTHKEIKKIQDTVSTHERDISRATAARMRKAHRYALQAKSMAVDNDVSFGHIRMEEDYVFATAQVSGLDVGLMLHTITMDIEGSLKSFTVDSADPNLPPMYRTVIRPSASSSEKDVMLMFTFNKKEREYPIIFEEVVEGSPDGSPITRRVLRDAATFESSACVSACIEPALLVYDQPTIMSLLDWATSGFLSRLTAVSVRPRYDGKFMIPPAPIPKKAMELNIEVRAPKALLPCNPRRGRVAGCVQDDGDDASYLGSNDHLSAELEGVTIRSSLDVKQLTQTIHIALSNFNVSQTVKAGSHVDPMAMGGPATIIPPVSMSLYLVNNLDSCSEEAQRVLVRMIDAPLQLITTPASMTRVLTLFCNNILNLDAPPPPSPSLDLLERRRDEMKRSQGVRDEAVECAADLDGFVQTPSAVTPSKLTIVDIVIGRIELHCQDAINAPQFGVILNSLKTQLLPDQKRIGWSDITIVDTRPKDTGFDPEAKQLLVCDASQIVLRNSFEEHADEAHYCILADTASWFTERGASCWEAGDAGMDSEKLRGWLPDAVALEGTRIDTATNRGVAVNAIEIDFEIQRFALTAQWLHVFDYLLNEPNMAALAPLTAPKDDEVVEKGNDTQLRLTLTARKFVVPLLSNTSDVLFTANLDQLTVSFTASDAGKVATKMIHVSLASVGLTHVSGQRILYSITDATRDCALLDVSLLIGNNATIIAVFMKELNAYVSMPIVNQLIYYASDPSQPMSQIAQLGVMKEERARLAALAAEQSKKGTLHLGLHWASPVLTVPCDARGDAALVAKKTCTEEVSERTLAVRLGDLTTVVDLINTTVDIQPVTMTRRIDELSLTVSEPATGLPCIVGQRSDTNIKVVLKNMNIQGLMQDTSVSVSMERTAWTPLAATATRYLAENASPLKLFAPASMNALRVQLTPTHITVSHQSLADTSNLLFMNLLLPTDVPDDKKEGDIAEVEEELPMPPCTSYSSIVFDNESLAARLYDTNGEEVCTFNLRHIHATIGGSDEASADRLIAYIASMDAYDTLPKETTEKMLSTTDEKRSVSIERVRCADNLITTTVGVSGIQFVVVPTVLGKVIDLFLTPLSEASSAKKSVADVDEDFDDVKMRSQLNVSLESFGVKLLKASGSHSPVVALTIDTSRVQMEDGKMVPLSAITGRTEDAVDVSVSELGVAVGRVEVLNLLAAEASGNRVVNPLFNNVVRQRSGCDGTGEFVTVKMLSLTDRKERPDGKGYFTLDSLLDVHVSSLEFILVPTVIAELSAAVDEASVTITNATKARTRATNEATSYMNEVSPSIGRMCVSLDNPMISVAPTAYYTDTLDLTPGSFRIEKSLSDPVDGEGVQWTSISVCITGMSTTLLGGEMLRHNAPITVSYASALKPPSFKEVPHAEPQPNRDNIIDDSGVLFSNKINVAVPDVAITLTEAQMLFLFRGAWEFTNAKSKVAEVSPTEGDVNASVSSQQVVANSTSRLEVVVGTIQLSALSLFEAQVQDISYVQATVGPTTSYYTAHLAEVYITHALWNHLDLGVRRQLRSIAEANLYPSSALLTAPSLTIALVRGLVATGTVVATPEDFQTIRDTRISLQDSEISVSPAVVQDVMSRIYEPMNTELFGARLIPEPILCLRHKPLVTLSDDLTLTNMRYLHVAGDDVLTYVLDLGGNTLSFSGIDPSPQIALAEDVVLTIRNGTINIPGLYSLDSFVHFSAGSKIAVEEGDVSEGRVTINQRLWRLSESHAPQGANGQLSEACHERIIDLKSGKFALGVQMLTTSQALARYLVRLRKVPSSEKGSDERKRLSSDAAKAMIFTAKPLECVEVGFMACGRFQVNLSINPITNKPVQQSIDVILSSLHSLDGKLLRDTEAQLQMIGVGNIQLIASISKVESLIVMDKINRVVGLVTDVTEIVQASFTPPDDDVASPTGDIADYKNKLVELEVRKKNLGAVQTKALNPRTFNVNVQMRDESTGFPYITKPVAGNCINCLEPGHATLSLSGINPTDRSRGANEGEICPNCAFGKASVAAFSGGECSIKKVDVLVVGFNGEMVEVTLMDLGLKQKAEEIMVDVAKKDALVTERSKAKETTSEARTTVSVDFTAVAQVFNSNFTTWEPILERLHFKARGWMETNVWHATLPQKTETTLSNYTISTLTALIGQFGNPPAMSHSPPADEVEEASPLLPVGILVSKRADAKGTAASEASERNESIITDVRLVNHLRDSLTIIEARNEEHAHPVQGRDSSIFPIEGSSCFVSHKDRRLRIFLNEHAYFTMADLVVEVSMESYTDSEGSSGKRCVVHVLPVHKSGSIIRIVSRVSCSLHNDSLGLLRGGEEIYIDSTFPLVNPFVMEPRDVEGGPYSPIETVGINVPTVRNILNGASPLVISKSTQSAAAISLSFRIRAESDGMICGAPRFSIIIDGGRKITNNVPIPVTVELLSGAQRIHSFSIPPLGTRQIIFNSGASSGIHFKFTCIQSVVNGADDDEHAKELRKTSRGEVVADEEEGRYVSSAIVPKRGTQRIVLQNLLQNVMYLQCTLNRTGSELTMFTPFAIVNHTPLPLRLVERTKSNQRMTNWEFLPAGMSVPMPVVPSEEQDTPELMTKVQALGHYETRDFVPLHAVETAGQIELVTAADRTSLQFSYYTTITSTGAMLITIVPRWVFVNRTPWSLCLHQFTTKTIKPVAMAAHTAHHGYFIQLPDSAKEPIQMCLVDPSDCPEVKAYDGRSEAMPFSVEELSDLHVTLQGHHHRLNPDRQLKVSVFPEGPRMFVTIEAVAASSYLLINRTELPITFSKPCGPSIPKQAIDATTVSVLKPQEVVRDVTSERHGRVLAFAEPSNARSFGLNGNSANAVLQSVVVSIGGSLDDDLSVKKGTPSYLITVQNPDGGIPSPDSPMHLGGLVSCRISQGSMGRTIVEILPFESAVGASSTTPTNRANTLSAPKKRIWVPKGPRSLDVGVNISYLSISLVEQPREIIFGVFVDVRGRFKRTPHDESYSFSILNFQFDNQSERAPPYEGCFFSIRPNNEHAAVQGFLRRRVMPGRAVLCFTAVRLDLMPIALRMSDVLIFHLREFAAGINVGPKAEESAREALVASHTYRNKETLYMTAPVAVGRDAMMVTIERMVINPIVIRLWFSRQRSDAKQDIIRSSTNAHLSYLVVSCEDVVIRIPGLTMQSQTAQVRGMLAKFKNFYLDGLKSQLFAVLFQYVAAIPLIGAPIKLVSDIGLGTYCVFQERIEGLTTSPEAFALGVASGTALVVGNVIGGSLNLVGLVAGSGAKLANIASGDSGKKLSTASGLLKGLTGIVTKPMHGAAEGGASGFFKGLGQGVVGVAANPIAGLLGDLSKATTLVGSVFTDKYIPEVKRLRPIRLFYPGGAVAPSSEEVLVEVFQYQRKYAGDSFWTNNLLPTDGSNWKPEKREQIEKSFGIRTPDAWVLDRRKGATFDGWTYGDVITGSFHLTLDDTVHLRRRRWVLILKEHTLSEVVPPLSAVEISCAVEEDNTILAQTVSTGSLATPTSRGSTSSMALSFSSSNSSARAAAVGAKYCSTKGDEVETVRVIDVYENERRYPLVGWTKKMLPTDRGKWSCRQGKSMEDKDAFPLTPGWAWEDDWHIVGGGKDGWEYALDFPQVYDSNCKMTDCVRRRLWRRTMKVQQ